MTANDSSSSDTNHLFELDLLASGRLPALPSAFLRGEHLDLLTPLRFLAPGDSPTGTAAGDRTAIAHALTAANQGYGHPRAKELGDLLADATTRVIATGQQPGLYGGPLLGLTKMIAALRHARRLQQQGIPAVAVFWVATEDHDWAEIAQTTFLGRQGVETFDLGPDPRPLASVGSRALGEELDAVGQQIEEFLGSPLNGQRFATIRNIYKSAGRFGEAFCRSFIELLGAEAPLFLDSMQPEVKQLQIPFLRRLVEAREELDTAYAEADEEVLARDFELQVNPQPGVSPLFLEHQGERRRIAWLSANTFGLRGLDGFEAPVDELLDIIEQTPTRVSPGVLARPAIQDALLGTSLQVMGPAELTYMTQARASYRILGIEAPQTSLRPQALILEPKQVSYLEELGVSVAELLDESIETLVAARLGEDVVGPIRQQIEALMTSLHGSIINLDATLEKPWRKTRDQMLRGLDMLKGKADAAVARKNDVWSKRLQQILLSVLPAGHLQERELSVAYFYARYERDVAAAMLEDLDLDPRQLNVIRLGAPS